LIPSDIVCRCCQKDYSVAEGCAICEGAKRNVVWPALNQDHEAADLHTLARRTVRLLRTQLDRLSHSITNAPTGAYDPVAGAELAKMSRAVANILTEARKLEEREEARVKGADFEQQLDIWGGWVLGLPREYQNRLVEWLEQKLLPPAPTDAVAEVVDEGDG
jgi:hypothetical protein